MKSFPLALRRLLPPRAHLAAHLHPAAGAVLRRARSRRCTRQPKKNHSKNLHAPLLPPAIHCSTRGFPRGLPLRALLPSASWSPGRRRCRARCALAGTGAASRGARDAAAATGARRRRRDAGRRTAAGGGAQGREIPIRSPDHSAAYREERRLSCRLRAAAAAATARHLAAPSSPSLPMPTHGQVPLHHLPLSHLSVSPPQPREKRARWRKGRPG